MKNSKYVSIYIPPYVEPKNEVKLANRGFSNVVILSLVTSIISIGIIILGIYLGM